MESRYSQLRFDISEKVCLHPQNPGMGTLLELDLYPDVNIKDEGNHLKIQGYLRLNGAYLSESDNSVLGQDQYANLGLQENRHELAYVIPVEITLPADRAEQGSISAEVESFDYQLLSPFELQIEAILLIDGLLPDQQVEEEAAESAELLEGFVFSGESARPTANEEEENSLPLKEEEVSKLQSNELTQSEPKAQKTIEVDQQQSISPDSHPTKPSEDQLSPPASSENEESVPEVIDLRVEAKKLETESLDEKDESEEVQNELEEVQEEKSTLSVPSPQDFWRERQKSKKEVQRVEVESKDSLENEEIVEVVDEENEEIVEVVDEENEEGNRWVGWLLKEKEEHFTPMKMVIVQKDETIDHLASRYQVSVENILESNQLKMDRLEEGQIVYVPVIHQQEQVQSITKEEGDRE